MLGRSPRPRRLLRGVLVALTGLFAVALTACEEPPHIADGPEPPPIDVKEMDAALMARHAGEIDAATDRMRGHLRTMRDTDPVRWPELVEVHAGEVSGFLDMLRRQMRELTESMDLKRDELAALLGMSEEEHARMMERMERIDVELGVVRTGSEAEIRRSFPPHLDRMERLVAIAERAGEHLWTAGR